MFTLNILLAVLCVIPLDTTMLHLDEVTVVGNHTHRRQTDNTQPAVGVDNSWLMQHDAGSLAVTLSDLPGVQASTIGSSQAKPAIRGLGFNRLAIIHNGIRHEGQQWGDDHGLEIDQFAIDRVEVIKGPSALLYGSDAVGGVILLSSYSRPNTPLSGRVRTFMRTNNMLFGASTLLEGSRGRFFWRANATYQNYADYRVPTDSIEYYSYRIPLHNRTLRNTAGREADGSLTVGYAGYRFHTCLKVYETFAESGFFANAHGLEVRLSDIDYDRSRRDIDLPRQSVNHMKVLSHSVYVQDDWSVEMNMAWQHNLRRERSEPVSHGYMPKPENDMERQFSKHTATINASAHWHVTEKHTLRFGLNSEMQHNRRDGWGFIIPDFEQYTAGVYASEHWNITKELTLNGGLRYDFVHTDIHSYNDWYTTPVSGTPVYVQRSAELHRNFNSLTWAVGVSYSPQQWTLKMNIGKGFRVPIAKELGADGINYHIFRYEQGNPALQAEKSYQLDISAAWEGRQLTVQIEPYFNFFPNYIYLNPTAYYREGLQMYYYTESRVVRTGFEALLRYQPLSWLQLTAQGEYLFARQLSGEKAGYGLPFSPPWRITPEVSFLWKIVNSTSLNSNKSSGYAAVNVHIAGAQYDIVPPEKPTDGWWTLNLQAGERFCLNTCELYLTLNADNILNRKYYDHTSYYRLIDVPEAGWNLSVAIGVEF